MDKATAIKLGAIGVGAVALWYWFSRPAAATQEETDFYGGSPTPVQIGDLADQGFFDPDPSNYVDKFNVPYFGNSPHNQVDPNPLDSIIDAVTNAKGGSIGCCAESSAPTTFIAPSMTQYQPSAPIMLPVPSMEVPTVAPKKRTLDDMEYEINAWRAQINRGNTPMSRVTGGSW